MPSPPIALYLTTIASQPALRQRQEYILRILQVKKIPFTSYDLASDEEAKRLWKRRAPLDKQQLPGLLIGGRFRGTFTDFEEAVEYDELEKFLRLKETWNPADDDHPGGPQQAIGVPGASMPLQMTPDRFKDKILAQQSPLKNKSAGVPVNKRQGDFDVGTELVGFGLQGVNVTEDELRDLVAELGLDEDDAGDLVKGLSDFTLADKTETKGKQVKEDKQESPAKPELEDKPEKEEGTDAVEEKNDKEKIAKVVEDR